MFKYCSFNCSLLMINFNCFLILFCSISPFFCSSVCATLDFCFLAVALAVVFVLFLDDVSCLVSSSISFCFCFLKVALTVVLDLVLEDICCSVSCSVSK